MKNVYVDVIRKNLAKRGQAKPIVVDANVLLKFFDHDESITWIRLIAAANKVQKNLITQYELNAGVKTLCEILSRVIIEHLSGMGFSSEEIKYYCIDKFGEKLYNNHMKKFVKW